MALLRKGGGNDSVPMGYRGIAANPLDVKGDQQAPFFKIPPFPVDAAAYFTADGLTDTPLITPVFDTTHHRICTLWIEYVNPGDDSILSVIPLAFNERSGGFIPVGTVDATLTPNGVFGIRNIFETDLQTPALVADTPFQATFDFQCAAYKSMVFAVRELVNPANGNTLELDLSSNE